jgi:hypothetical protein
VPILALAALLAGCSGATAERPVSGSISLPSPLPSVHQVTKQVSISGSASSIVTASCPASEWALSGGWIEPPGSPIMDVLISSRAGQSGWQFELAPDEPTPGAKASVTLTLACMVFAPTGTVVTEASSAKVIPPDNMDVPGTGTTVGCPSSALLVGGGYTASPGVTVFRSQNLESNGPSYDLGVAGAKAWFVDGVMSSAGGAGQGFIAHAECLTMSGSPGVQGLLEGESPPFAPQTVSGAAACPPGTFVTGGGFVLYGGYGLFGARHVVTNASVNSTWTVVGGSAEPEPYPGFAAVDVGFSVSSLCLTFAQALPGGVTPTAAPRRVPTPSSSPDQLSVSPSTITGFCFYGSWPTAFSLANTGSSQVSWISAINGAGTGNTITLTPASGVLNPGAQVTITVSGRDTTSGPHTLTLKFLGVTFLANGAPAGAAATETVTCQ